MRSAVSALLLVLVAAPAMAAAQDANLFRPADVFELEYATDPQVSPDGRRIAYVRTGMDIMSDRQRGHLWMIDGEGDGHRALTTGSGSYGSPRWSPDGTRLLYVHDGQIWVRWMDTGQSATLTNVTESPRDVVWSPDGRWIAFTMLLPERGEPMATLPPKPEGAEWAAPPRVIEKLIYRQDGAGYVEDGYTHVFVLPAEGGTPRQLTSGSFNHNGTPQWTPDGVALILSANRHDEWEYDPRNSEIYELGVADGRIRPLTSRAGPDGSPAVSPDGRQIAYTGFDDRYQGYQVTRLYVMGRDGSGSRLLTEGLDRDVQNPQWSGDGRGIYFQFDDEGTTKIGYVPAAGGAVETVAGDVGGLSLGRPYAGGDFSIAANGRIVYTHTGPDHPADLAMVTRGQEPRRLTRLNDDLLGHKGLGTVEEIWYESSFDGRRVQAWIVTPPDFDPTRKYPLLLEIHGGPFANYGDRFAAEIQLYAAAGYVVLYANPRGSTSYGEEFGNLIHHNYPGQDFDDLMSGVDAVIARGYVDENNLFVTGGSGGGVLTAWIVGNTGRFRAAVVAKPVINWYSFVLTSDAYNFFYKYWFPGFPWEHQEQYMARSPISLVGNVTTPTMLLTGEADHRTPMSETEQYYQALKLRKVEAAMVRIPGASHGIANRPSQLIAKVAHILAWFDRYRDPAAEPTRAASDARE
jgi:acylaminoacyl-peptidase